MAVDGWMVVQPASFSEPLRLREDIHQWCCENLTADWRFIGTIIKKEFPFHMIFVEEVDYVLFKLRWIG